MGVMKEGMRGDWEVIMLRGVVGKEGWVGGVNKGERATDEKRRISE